jgi:hypothetical protein
VHNAPPCGGVLGVTEVTPYLLSSQQSLIPTLTLVVFFGLLSFCFGFASARAC